MHHTSQNNTHPTLNLLWPADLYGWCQAREMNPWTHTHSHSNFTRTYAFVIKVRYVHWQGIGSLIKDKGYKAGSSQGHGIWLKAARGKTPETREVIGHNRQKYGSISVYFAHYTLYLHPIAWHDPFVTSPFRPGSKNTARIWHVG